MIKVVTDNSNTEYKSTEGIKLYFESIFSIIALYILVIMSEGGIYYEKMSKTFSL